MNANEFLDLESDLPELPKPNPCEDCDLASLIAVYETGLRELQAQIVALKREVMLLVTGIEDVNRKRNAA